MAKLKLFRTAIGFHDAYVAATSRKAALAAWGSDKDLFARGAAEEVTDPAAAPDALAAPGTVVKRLRGTAAEQLAAAPPSARKAKPAAEADDPPVRRRKTPAPRPTPPPKPKPKPSRDPLDAAEAALVAAERRHRDVLATIADREAALARERRAAEREAADQTRRLTRDRDAAARDYDDAMRRWRG